MADSVVGRGARLLAAVALSLVIVVVLTLETAAVLMWDAVARRLPGVSAD
jgi:hypothetical protein